VNGIEVKPGPIVLRAKVRGRVGRCLLCFYSSVRPTLPSRRESCGTAAPAVFFSTGRSDFHSDPRLITNPAIELISRLICQPCVTAASRILTHDNSDVELVRMNEKTVKAGPQPRGRFLTRATRMRRIRVNHQTTQNIVMIKGEPYGLLL